MTKQELAEKYIEEALLRGRWKLSERLPAERELAVELGVNRGTLRAALQTLTGKEFLKPSMAEAPQCKLCRRNALRFAVH